MKLDLGNPVDLLARACRCKLKNLITEELEDQLWDRTWACIWDSLGGRWRVLL